MDIIAVPAFRDNYIWLLHNGKQAVVVDPGDAVPVEKTLAAMGLELVALLITHHHADHTGGISALTAKREIPVFGPATEGIDGITHPVEEGDTVELPALGVHLEVIHVPGHTLGHIAYYGQGCLFCGDTLFSAGCGRLFEGTAEQMYASLSKLAALPAETRVFCAHEYTLSNLEFARRADPDNPRRDEWLERCETLRRDGIPTIPSTIGTELAVNPFLRWNTDSVREAAGRWAGHRITDPVECFAAVREWKNQG